MAAPPSRSRSGERERDLAHEALRPPLNACACARELAHEAHTTAGHRILTSGQHLQGFVHFHQSPPDFKRSPWSPRLISSLVQGRRAR